MHTILSSHPLYGPGVPICSEGENVSTVYKTQSSSSPLLVAELYIPWWLRSPCVNPGTHLLFQICSPVSHAHQRSNIFYSLSLQVLAINLTQGQASPYIVHPRQDTSFKVNTKWVHHVNTQKKSLQFYMNDRVMILTLFCLKQDP